MTAALALKFRSSPCSPEPVSKRPPLINAAGVRLCAAVKRILRDNNCHFARHGRGDHDMWYSPITNRNVTVDHEIKSRHTANGVLKQAGIPKAF